MKNNRGFTFVELIAVLVIIVILFVVSLPPIMRIFKSTQLKVDEGIQKIIEDGTKDLLVNETASYDNNDTNKYCIKISELIEKGYITEELVKDVDKDVFSVVTFEKNKPKVELHTACVEEINNIYFVLKGDKETTVTLGSTYSDPGVEAYDKQGNNIAGNVKTYITDERLVEQPIVDTSIIGTYVIEYQLIYETKYLTLERIVNVVSDGKPVITHPGDDVFGINVTTYDVMEGVSAVDKNGNSVPVIAKTNLALGLVGEYTITYTATDVSGNTSVARRLIQINDKYVERLLNGADPILASTMYPVVYDEAAEKWKVASKFEKWYCYAEKMWANVVTLESGVAPLNPGDYVNINNVNSFMVWIPRYEYKINYRTDGLEYDPNYGPYAIDISFNAYDTPSSPDFIIHPGFKLGDVEQTGFWMDKFEISTLSTASIGAGYSAVYRSVPNVVSLVNVRLADNWTNIYNMQQLTTGTTSRDKFDTHLVKAIEWGTVSYLANSLYGRCDTKTHCTKVSINDSVGFYTGRSAGLNTPDGTKESGSYVYNDLTYGVMASTTGTIYGVYDMAGGRAELNMTLVYSSDLVTPVTGGCLGAVILGRCIVQTQSTGFNGKYIQIASSVTDVDITGEHNWKDVNNDVPRPDDKYIDYYDFNKKKSDGQGGYNIIPKTGDAMSELRPIEDGNKSGRRGWFGNRIEGPNAVFPVVARGGSSMLDTNETAPEYSNYSEVGLFTVSDTIGKTGSTEIPRQHTTRKVVTVD